MSEILLRADIDARYVSYRQVALAFMSTMAELGKSDEALAVIEEVQPGVTSPDFRPQYDKQQTLHYHAILALAQLQSKEDTLSMLDAVVSRWDESFPRWRDNPANVAAIEMARGQTELAIELALEDLDDGMRGAALYRNIGYFKALARQPAVATRLAELDAEAKKAGEEIWAYIVEHQLQL